MNSLRISMVVLLIACALELSGCAGRRGGSEPPLALTESEVADPAVGHVEQVRKLARRSIETDLRTRNDDKERVRFERPYYFKEYADYPNGSNDLEITLQETDSRTAPVQAKVKYEKVRYVTKLHTRRTAAEADRNFYRDTGEEIMTFELRNNRWVQLGATFVAERSEESVAGEWQPVQERTPRLTPDEVQSGFFGRTWNRLTGGT